MRIHISTSDGVPIYLQIVNQVKYLAAAGQLVPGEELPPIRTLAERLVVNPNTVARAYRELEAEGVVEKRRTAGTYISEHRAAIESARTCEDPDPAHRCPASRGPPARYSRDEVVDLSTAGTRRCKVKREAKHHESRSG